jgi:hypothetical protein
MHHVGLNDPAASPLEQLAKLEAAQEALAVAMGVRICCWSCAMTAAFSKGIGSSNHPGR